MKNLYLILILLLFITGCALFDNYDENQYADDAEEFALIVVETFFNNDQAAFESYLPQKIYWCEPDESPIMKSELDTDNIFSHLSTDSLTIEDYKNHYDYEILVYSEYKDKDWIRDIHYWKPDDQDFLFLGNELIDGKSELILDDLLIFFIRHENSSWKVRALWG